MDSAIRPAHAAPVTICMTYPQAPDAVERFDNDQSFDHDVDAAALLEFVSHRRRLLRERAYRRLAATILSVDVASLATELATRRAAPSPSEPRIDHAA